MRAGIGEYVLFEIDKNGLTSLLVENGMAR